MQFHETRYGAKFFDGQLPKLITALTDIALALKAPTPVYQLRPEIPENFLTDLYLGNYDPSDFPATEREKELAPEIVTVQEQLRELVPVDAWALIDRYGELLAARGTAEREQAFAAGFQSAMTMLAAGLACPTAARQEVNADGKN